MTNKVLVKVYVPLIEDEFEVWMPINKRISDVIQLLCKSINEMTGGYFSPSRAPSLYNKASGKQLNIYFNVKEACVKNGTELIII